MIYRFKFRVHGGRYPGKYSYNVAEGTTQLLDESFRPVAMAGEARYGLTIRAESTSVELLQPGARWNGASANKPVQVRTGHLLTSDGVSVEILDCPAVPQTGREVTQFLDLNLLAGATEVRPAPAPAPAASVTTAQENVPLATFAGQGVAIGATHAYEVPDKVVAPVTLEPATHTVPEAPSRFGIAPLPAGADPACDTDTEAVPEEMLSAIASPAAAAATDYETVHEPVRAIAPPPYGHPPEEEPVETPYSSTDTAPPAAATPDFSATRPARSFLPTEEPMRARENTLRRAAIIACTFVVLICGAHYVGKHFPVEFFEDQEDTTFVATISRPRPKAQKPAPAADARVPASVAEGQQAPSGTVAQLPVEPAPPPAPKAPTAEDLKAFTEAIDAGDMTVVVRMIDNERVSPDFALDPLGRSPFLRAAASGRVTAMQYLLSKKVSTTASDYNGNNALMWAVINGHEKTVKFLLGLGLNPSAKRDDGKDSFTLAREYRQTGVVKILREEAKNNRQSDDRKPASRK
jgi:hypothetical protein